MVGRGTSRYGEIRRVRHGRCMVWLDGFRSGLVRGQKTRYGCGREMHGTDRLGRAGHCSESSVGDWKGSGRKAGEV